MQRSAFLKPYSAMRYKILYLVAALLLAVSHCGVVIAAETWKLEIDAGKKDRQQLLVRIAAPKVFNENQTLANQSYEIRNSDGDVVAAQVIATGESVEIVFVLPKLGAGKSTLTLQPTTKKPAAVVHVDKDVDGNLEVLRGDKPMLKYLAALQESPIKNAPYYERSGYVHPLYDPEGNEVTDDFSPDHAHQHAMFMAWVNTKFQGKKRDFWNQHSKQGTVEHKNITATAGGPVAGYLSAELQHITLPEKTAALNETWQLLAVPVVDSGNTYYLLDFVSRQTCATDEPLHINEYHYGGFAIRGRRNWLPAACDFLTSEGKTREDGNHTRVRWCSLFGAVDAKTESKSTSSVTVLGNEQNLNAPQHVRLHPKMPYFCFAPMVAGEFTIKPGEPFVSRYRLIITADKPDPQLLDRLWEDYNHPPKTRWLP